MFRVYLLGFLLLITSCGDKNADIPIKQNPLEVFPDKMIQNVLVEHISSEQNEETINATKQVQSYKTLYGNRVVAVAFHENDFLETPNTKLIGDLLGGYINNPKASYNRGLVKNTQFSEDNILWLHKANWDWAMQQRLADTAKVALAMSSGQDKNGLGYITTYFAHKESISSCKLVVYFVTDSVLQSAQVGATSTYYHKDVFTDVFPHIEGMPVDLSEENEQGIITQYNFNGIDLSQFNLSKLNIVSVLYTDNIDFRKRKVLNVQQARFGGIKFWDSN